MFIRTTCLADGTQRPVVVLGPLSGAVAARLASDWPHAFGLARPAALPVAGAAPALQRGTHLEPRLRPDCTHIDCIPLHAIRELAEKV